MKMLHGNFKHNIWHNPPQEQKFAGPFAAFAFNTRKNTHRHIIGTIINLRSMYLPFKMKYFLGAVQGGKCSKSAKSARYQHEQALRNTESPVIFLC